MNINPNGYDGGDIGGFQDPTPLLEGCDPATCTARVGGDHSITCERCWLCGRDTFDGLYRNVDTKADGIVRCCDNCWEKGNEGIEVPLDMTEDVA